MAAFEFGYVHTQRKHVINQTQITFFAKTLDCQGTSRLQQRSTTTTTIICNTKMKGNNAGKNRFFLLEILKNCTLNERYNPQVTTIRAFFSKLGHFFQFLKEGRGEIPPPPSSYAQDFIIK